MLSYASTQLQLLTSCILSFLLVLTTLLQYLQLYMKAVSLWLHSTWSRMSPFSLAILPHSMHCHFLTAPSITMAMWTKNMLSLSWGEGLASAAPDTEIVKLVLYSVHTKLSNKIIVRETQYDSLICIQLGQRKMSRASQ